MAEVGTSGTSSPTCRDRGEDARRVGSGPCGLGWIDLGRAMACPLDSRTRGQDFTADLDLTSHVPSQDRVEHLAPADWVGAAQRVVVLGLRAIAQAME
jgi:hypothetical protein